MTDYALLGKTLCHAYKKPGAIFVTCAGASLFFFLMLLIPNYAVLSNVFISNLFTPLEKIGILLGTLGTLPVFFTPLGQVIMIATAALVGIILHLLTFSMTHRLLRVRMTGSGGLGIISSILGIGCASCGSVILSSLIGISATTGILSVLPLGNNAFGVIGILILFLTIRHILKKMSNTPTC